MKLHELSPEDRRFLYGDKVGLSKPESWMQNSNAVLVATGLCVVIAISIIVVFAG